MHCLITPAEAMNYWKGAIEAHSRIVKENHVGNFWKQFNKVPIQDWFDYDKIAGFWKEVLSSPEDSWFSENEVIYEDAAILLRLARKGTTGKAILIVPPQAGHPSTIADFDDGQSLVQTAVAATEHTIVVVDWKSCTLARKDESLDDLVTQLKTAIDKTPEELVFLVGLCQGGWLSAITAYLYPEKVAGPPCFAGSPINLGVQRELSAPCRIVDVHPQKFYEGLVAAGGGLMKGELMLMGWKSGNFIDRYYTDYVKIFQSADTDNMEKMHRFRGWYETVQDLAGNWYLEVVDRMFRKNEMWDQKMKIHGRIIKLQELPDIFGDVISIGSDGDDITPLEQAIALGNTTYKLSGVGHIGLFMSSKVQAMWQEIFGMMK
jgi:poly(3-hydroxyalkanoate) synthetase